jgi:alpha-galactosidase
MNLDDCWAYSRNESGHIIEDPNTFPSGMAALSDYVHSLGLKFGIYSDAGTHTCAISPKRPGSLGFETQDAQTYAEWNVDLLKVCLEKTRFDSFLLNAVSYQSISILSMI